MEKCQKLKLKYLTSGGFWGIGPRGFFVGLGLLHEATEFHKYP